MFNTFNHRLSLIIFLLITYASPSFAASSSPNFLLIIADDLGVDALGAYSITSNPPKTPNIDALARSGVVFENFWVTPACTTTRAALISGQHGFESGVDYVPAVMSDSTLTLQQRLKQADIPQAYATGVFGKWHLGGPNADFNHPARFGIDDYAGNLFNLGDYNNWTLTQNGSQRSETAYHTTKVTDLALDFIYRNTNKPWFSWVAYSAPHRPFHAPPSHLISSSTPTNRVPDQYRAMIEAMDTEIGRLINSLPAEDKQNTVIVFLGDNGTPKRARDRAVFDKSHVKGSLYEGGIRTPFIVAGNPITRKGSRESAVVNATDIFATFTSMAVGHSNLPNIPKNSLSFHQLLSGFGSPNRKYNYSEWRKSGNLSWTVRDANYKVLKYSDGRTELFSMSDISERNPVNNTQIMQHLLGVGEAIRRGERVN